MARKKARHWRRAKSWEIAANRGDRKLDQFTRAFWGNSHTACGYDGLGSSPAGERLRLDGQSPANAGGGPIADFHGERHEAWNNLAEALIEGSVV